MKLFVTALSVPALAVCGALALTTYGIYEGATRLLNPPPPKLPIAFRVAPPPFRLDDIVRVVAHKHGVKQGFVKSIIAAESAFDQTAISPKGAIGLMQLMPETAREYGVDPTDADQNVEGGTHYLSFLLYRYRKYRDQLQRTIAAYNAGPGNVDHYRGIPPFRETRDYVKRVMAYYRKFEATPIKKSWKSAHARRVHLETSD